MRIDIITDSEHDTEINLICPKCKLNEWYDPREGQSCFVDCERMKPRDLIECPSCHDISEPRGNGIIWLFRLNLAVPEQGELLMEFYDMMPSLGIHAGMPCEVYKEDDGYIYIRNIGMTDWKVITRQWNRVTQHFVYQLKAKLT